MVALTTLKTLSELEREMSRAGRSAEEDALREAVRALARRREEFLTTGEAAERLGISIPTVKRWIERGALLGGPVGGRWLVSRESVEQLVRVRGSLLDLDREGYPTAEEVRELYERRQESAEKQQGVAPSRH